MTDGPSHKHHFVPAFYLKRWAIDGKVIAWSRPKSEIVRERKHPNAIGFEVDLYTFPKLPPSGRQWFEETFLKLVDDHAAQALHQLIDKQNTRISDKLRSGWSRFVFGLPFRHPDILPELLGLVREAWEDQLSLGRATYEQDRRERDPVSYENYLALMTAEMRAAVHVNMLKGLMDNARYGNRINNMIWQVLDLSKAPYPLLTSDWPAGFAFGAKTPHVLMPIDPTHLFVAMDDVALAKGLERAPAADLARDVNRIVVSQARRYVFSSDETQETFIRNRMSSAAFKPPFFK